MRLGSGEQCTTPAVVTFASSCIQERWRAQLLEEITQSMTTRIVVATKTLLRFTVRALPETFPVAQSWPGSGAPLRHSMPEQHIRVAYAGDLHRKSH